MGLHNLKAPHGSHKKRKLLGRGAGSGHGKTSTRGSKGATSRSGPGTYLGFEGGQSPLIRKMPKRGFHSRSPKVYQVVNLEVLTKVKEDMINPALMLEKGFIKSKSLPVKILGNGELKAAKIIYAHAFSKKAQEKIKNTGGKIDIL
ncbi:MAG: 50S ribosomal protein L15 [Candidatus Omnitrophota bacterium]